VTIGAVGFEWHPAQLEDFVSTSRGTDNRLVNDTRPRADERRFAKNLRRAERLGLDTAPDALPADSAAP